MTDSELLHQFTHGSEKAFAELVQRHVDLVFAAAFRHLGGDRHGAEDIVQKVFIDLARKARTLTRHPTLAGWLYSSTRYTAINTVRSAQRRAVREKQTSVMGTTAAGSEPPWEKIGPVLDDALQELKEVDRQSVLLRFFGQQAFGAIAVQLGISENAAQKRVERALDHLQVALKRRGISSTGVALGLVLAESCVAAPASLAGAVTAAALAHAAGVGTFAIASLWKLGATAAAIGVLSWVGVQWLRPGKAVEKQSLPPVSVALNAKPTQREMASNRFKVEEAPDAIGSNLSEPLENTAPQPARVHKVYAVRAGDTLNRIARAVEVTSAALLLENPGYNFSRMRVGDEVFLPATATIPSPVPQMPGATIGVPSDQVYTVEPGDTLLKIARKRDLLPDELKLLNPETNWQQLRIGQRIHAP